MMLGDVLKGRWLLRLMLVLLGFAAIGLNAMRWRTHGPSSDYIPIPLIGIVIAVCLIGILFAKHDSRIRSRRRHLTVGLFTWTVFLAMSGMCGTIYGGLLGPMSHAECVNGQPTSFALALPWDIRVQRYARPPNGDASTSPRCLTAAESARLAQQLQQR